MAYMLNISFVVEPTIYGNWYSFMYDKFIPFVKESGKYQKVIFSRILSEGVSNHYTFSLLLDLESLDGYHYLNNEIMKEYMEFAEPMFGVKVTHFVTLMKKI
ncbi:MAG: DUF4286 family protein [Rikenellaceae bacterium]